MAVSPHDGRGRVAQDDAGAHLPAQGDVVEPLACGRDAATVWDHAEAGTLDAHERECPHCGAAVADARGLEAMVSRLAAQPLVPPPTVVDRVVGAVLAELRPRDLLVLDSPTDRPHSTRPRRRRCCAASSTRWTGCARAAAGSPGPRATRGAPFRPPR
ncbi:hypothetical protein ACFQV8_27140 [Pseudonocardia benzenivorans]